MTLVLQDSDDTKLQHAAVACIDRIIEKYGKKGINDCVDAVRTVAGEHCLGSDDVNLSILALFCLSTAADVLGEAIIPSLPVAVPRTLMLLERSLTSQPCQERLHRASFSFMSSLLVSVPYMVAGLYLDRVLAISGQYLTLSLPDECNESRLEFLSLVGIHIGSSDCFSTLDRTWDVAAAAGVEAVEQSILLLDLCIDKQPKSVIAKCSDLIFSVFLKAFGFRESCLKNTNRPFGEDMTNFEEDVNQAFIKMVYKLNDTRLRPLFSKLADWATTADLDNDRRNARQIPWFGLLDAFFGTLKVSFELETFVPRG